MMRRLLGRMGMSGYIPGSNDFGLDNRNTDAPDAPLGEAQITFLGGAKTPYSPEEAAQQERGEDIGNDLVWPGKPTTIGLRNDESLSYRYDLTITNLPDGYYIILPPTGGTRQTEGGVLLQPGEETVFEVRFPPIAREQIPPQNFHFVLTRFDPRRRSDPGVVVGEDAARWVPLPSSNDFALRVNTGELRLRPWRRNAKFLLSLDDRSFLPSTANLHILRAPTRQALSEHAEQVDTISQSLEARTSGTWRCELPPSQLRTSCWVTARGAVRVGEHQSVPVALPKPIYVRYVPWLRMGRDWAVVASVALLLAWGIWGVPVYKSPIVRLALDFPKGLPPQASLQDLTVTLIPASNPEKHLEGKLVGNEFEFHLPGHWYGWHLGWNRWGRDDLRFTVVASVTDKEDANKYKIYRLGEKLKEERGREDFRVAANERPVWHNWVIERKAKVRLQKQEPRIATLVPNEIQSEQVFTIHGEGFGKEPGKIFFNGAWVPGAIQNWTEDSVAVKCPKGAQAGMMQVQLQSSDDAMRSDVVLLTISKAPEAPALSDPKTTPLSGAPRNVLATPNRPLPTRPASPAPERGGKAMGNVAHTAAPKSTPGGAGAPNIAALPPPAQLPTPEHHEDSPRVQQLFDEPTDVPENIPEAPSRRVVPPTMPAGKWVQKSSKNPATVSRVTAEVGEQNVIVPSTAKTLVLQSSNIGTHKDAWLNGKTKLPIRNQKAGMTEVELPRNSTSSLALLELTGDRRTVLSSCTLYRVPNGLHSNYDEQNRDAPRDDKEIASLFFQGDAAFRTAKEQIAQQNWSSAYRALQDAEAQNASILQSGHTQDDALKAHFNLALIARLMSQLAPSLTKAPPSHECLNRAWKEAWMAAQEASRAQTSPTAVQKDQICQLLKELKSDEGGNQLTLTRSEALDARRGHYVE